MAREEEGMRDRPFIQANEPSRPYSEVRSEREDTDPKLRRRRDAIDRIAMLESEGRQLEAEALRCDLEETR